MGDDSRYNTTTRQGARWFEARARSASVSSSANASPLDAEQFTLQASNEFERIVPYGWRAFFVPLFFSVSLVTVNLQHYLRHLSAPVAPPATLNRYIFFAFFFTLLWVSWKSSVKSHNAMEWLFIRRAHPRALLDKMKANPRISSAVTGWFAEPDVIRQMFANVRKLPTFYTILTALLFSPFLFICISIVCYRHPAQEATFGLTLIGISGSLFVALVAYLSTIKIKRIRDSYLFISTDPELASVVNTTVIQKIGQTESADVIDFDAFADIQRWFKRRFSQKSWKKSAFIVVLMGVFICGDGLRILISTITYFTGLIGSSVVASSANTAADVRSNLSFGSLHLFNNLLLALGLGGIFAYFCALMQPTHLRLSPDGIDVLYKRKRFGKNIKRVAWQDIKALSLNTPSGTTLVGEKELRFEGTASTLLKFKLNCIDSVASREKILQSIETHAPSLRRGAEIIQILQRPADQSYTELWLQTLASPPKRDRLKPLVSNSVLQDGRYIISRALGLGGQGTAYLSRDTKTNQTVVLKEFILPIYVDTSVRRSALERFENEARILQHLNHPQIVKLSNFFVEDHRGYLALDYIEGADLKKRVETSGKLAEVDVVPMALQMCEILHYLHTQIPPVIHRDFTPDNLILQPDGLLKLIDFNVAQQTSTTVTGTIVGKQCYLPPEQFQGDPVVQSDIYAMGATIYFLCTGVDPEPISQSHPADIEPGISQGLNVFVANCTTIDPDLRYKNADECLADLKRLVGATENF